MNTAQIIAIMAAIIYSGADDNERAPGHNPETAVEIAVNIYKEARTACSEDAQLGLGSGE